jgi:hypothetical protein
MNHIYWATVRDNNKRLTYIEITQLGNNRWGVLFGDEHEFTVKTEATDFFSVLHVSLQEAERRGLSLSQ